MNSKNKKISYGSVELPEMEFEPQSVKVRITTMIDEDLIIALKKLAKSTGQKYQTILNQILRMQLGQSRQKTATNTEKTIRRIVREELKKRA